MSVPFALYVHDDFLMYICYRHACRNLGSEKLARWGCTCVQFRVKKNLDLKKKNQIFWIYLIFLKSGI